LIKETMETFDGVQTHNQPITHQMCYLFFHVTPPLYMHVFCVVWF